MPLDRKNELGRIAKQIANLSKASWVVAPAIAEFSAKNPSFKRVEAALRRYLDENSECFHSVYVALGGRPEDLREIAKTPRVKARRVLPGRRNEDVEGGVSRGAFERTGPERRSGSGRRAQSRKRTET